MFNNRLFSKSPFLLFIGVFLGGLIVGSIFFIQKGSPAPFINERILFNPPQSTYDMRPVDGDDHIWGSLDATIVVVEFLDLECEFCKKNHFDMERIVNEYKGEVAWVVRHHPLDHRFTKSRIEAEASECAAAQGGNSKFFQYIGKVFEVTPSNNGLDLDTLPDIAVEIGLDREAFERCLEEGTFVEEVEKDVQDARRAGLSVTPSMIILREGGERSLIIGSQRYERLRMVFDYLLDV